MVLHFGSTIRMYGVRRRTEGKIAWQPFGSVCIMNTREYVGNIRCVGLHGLHKH